MPAFANIVLNDGTSNKTFSPESKLSGERYLYLERSSGQSNLYDSLIVSKRTTPSGVSKSNFDLNFTKKVTDTSTGVISPSSKSQIKIECNFAPDVTQAERTVMINKAQALVTDALFVAVAENGESIY